MLGDGEGVIDEDGEAEGVGLGEFEAEATGCGRPPVFTRTFPNWCPTIRNEGNPGTTGV